MIRSGRRTPKNYDGTQLTTHHVGDVLKGVLQKIGAAHQERPDLILAAWPEIVGLKTAPSTQAVSFVDGVLLVHVKHPLILAVLTSERTKLLESLRKKFPKVLIKALLFRIG